jgi:hypothetical protein
MIININIINTLNTDGNHILICHQWR